MCGWMLSQGSQKIGGTVPGGEVVRVTGEEYSFNSEAHRGSTCVSVSPDLKAYTSTGPVLKSVRVSVVLDLFALPGTFLPLWLAASRVQATTCGCWFFSLKCPH